ncbi:GH92 family glycosyl hydrolase [Saccharothrix sp. 6-C]|uniref:GH92 family glycosyl hydrolase n=1 Tax=Saccharothrix sp. 6-C TaxID=2781735 RepID=UPI001916D809|nr:GH92 family glycosyl hydrolase [Saccharothrix sp. 6-C]QQQ79462.1 GH92 family glycosyl hydrolase [Saccharothrix sp. 6-C]
MSTRRPHPAVVLAVALAASAATAATPAHAQPPPLVTDPTSLVNHFIGTGSGGEHVGSVNTFPGAVAPFGMLSWSPETTSRPAGGGYDHRDQASLGLSVTHLSGVGCPVQGDLPILPTVGAVTGSPAGATLPFSHADEKASPGLFETKLGDAGTGGAITARVAATTRTGVGRFTFPATEQANLLFKAGSSQVANTAAQVRVTGPDQLAGTIAGGRFCERPNTSAVHFAAVFDRPFAATGTWHDDVLTPGGTAVDHPRGGAWVTFDTRRQRQVGVKVAISYVSPANALANLRAEAPGWDVDGVAGQTRAAWHRLLSKIQVGGGTRDRQTQFYTALYHSLLHPNVFSDVNGQYTGFDNRVHTSDRVRYANFSGWDTYRTLVQLQAVLAPAETSAMMQSLVDMAAEGGWLPKWPVANGYTGVMNGDAAAGLLSSAHAFGARDFDTRAALAALVKGATRVPTPAELGQGWYEQRPGLAEYLRDGYVHNTKATDISHVPNGASATLEYAMADFGISRFAGALGDQATARAFLVRSQNWTTLVNRGSGFLQPRDATGAFPAGNPVTTGMGVFGQSGFQEGNAAQYLWLVPHDVRGLLDAVGGDARAISRLDRFFTRDNAGPNNPFYWAGNEVNMHVPYLYNYAGAPWRTQEVVRRTLDTRYANTPGGEPGNDDLGALSSWYVWSAMGLYPATPGTDVLTVTTPLFPRVQVDLPGHRTTITSTGSGAYLRGLSVDGTATQRTWLPGSALLGDGPGGRAATSLAFGLTGQPDRTWGTGADARPPSFPAGAPRFPPGVTPVELTTSPARPTVAVGSPSTAALSFAVGAGAEPATPVSASTVSWRATPPAGVTVTPAEGTARVVDGVATAQVSLQAAEGVVQGFTSIPVVLTSEVALSPVSVPVAVVGSGASARVCGVLGATNRAKGITHIESGGDGVTTPVTVGGREARRMVERVPGGLHMYFSVDERIAADGRFPTAFTVDYFDEGAHSWSLQYDSRDGSAYQHAGSVTNTGTNTWKTATITVPDAALAHRQNERADFRLASGSPVVVHRVTAVVDGPGVLPMDLCG